VVKPSSLEKYARITNLYEFEIIFSGKSDLALLNLLRKPEKKRQTSSFHSIHCGQITTILKPELNCIENYLGNFPTFHHILVRLPNPAGRDQIVRSPRNTSGSSSET